MCQKYLPAGLVLLVPYQKFGSTAWDGINPLADALKLLDGALKQAVGWMASNQSAVVGPLLQPTMLTLQTYVCR